MKLLSRFNIVLSPKLAEKSAKLMFQMFTSVNKHSNLQFVHFFLVSILQSVFRCFSIGTHVNC